MADPQNPFDLFTDQEWRANTPVELQYAKFQQLAKHNEQWLKMPHAEKSKVFNHLFGTKDPYAFLQNPAFRERFTPEQQTSIFNAVVDEDPNWHHKSMNNRKRQEIRAEFLPHMAERLKEADTLKAYEEAAQQVFNAPSAEYQGEPVQVDVSGALTPEARQVQEAKVAAARAGEQAQAEAEAAQRRAALGQVGQGGEGLGGPGSNVINPDRLAAPPVPATQPIRRPDAELFDAGDAYGTMGAQPDRLDGREATNEEIMRQYWDKEYPDRIIQDDDGKTRIMTPDAAAILGQAEFYRQQAIARDPVAPSDRYGGMAVLQLDAAMNDMFGREEAAAQEREMVRQSARLLPNDFEPVNEPEVGWVGEKLVGAMFTKEGRDQWFRFLREQGPQTAMMSLVAAPTLAVPFGGPFVGMTARGAARAGLTAWVLDNAAQRVPESLMEAGAAFQAALDRGKSRDEAYKDAMVVGGGNMALIGLDALQAYAPAAATSIWSRLPGKYVTNATVAGLGKMGLAVVGWRFAAKTEKWEEMYQEGLHQMVEGEADLFDWSTERAQKAGKAGEAMGAVFGAPGLALAGANINAKAEIEEAQALKDRNEEIKRLAERLGAEPWEISGDLVAARQAAGEGILKTGETSDAEIKRLAEKLKTDEAEIRRDIEGAYAAAGEARGFEDMTPAPKEFEQASPEETEGKAGAVQWPDGLPDEVRKELESLPPSHQQLILRRAVELWNKRVEERSKRPEYQGIPFPKNEGVQIGLQAIVDTLAVYREVHPQAQSAEEEVQELAMVLGATEAEVRANVPAARAAAGRGRMGVDPQRPPEGSQKKEKPKPPQPVAQKGAPKAPAPSKKIGDWVDEIKNAKDEEELNRILVDLNKNDPQRAGSKKIDKAVNKKREAFATRVGLDNIVMGTGEQKPLGSLEQGSGVRHVTDDGAEIVGRVYKDPSTSEIGIDDGNTIHYFPADTNVDVRYETYPEEPAPKPKPKPKKKGKKFSGMTMEDWVNDYTLTNGTSPSVEELVDYMNEGQTASSAIGGERQMGGGANVTAKSVGNAIKSEPFYGRTLAEWVQDYRNANDGADPTPGKFAKFVSDEAGLKGNERLDTDMGSWMIRNAGEVERTAPPPAATETAPEAPVPPREPEPKPRPKPKPKKKPAPKAQEPAPAKPVPLDERKGAVRNAASGDELDAIRAEVQKEVDDGLRNNFPSSLTTAINLKKEDLAQKKAAEPPKKKTSEGKPAKKKPRKTEPEQMTVEEETALPEEQGGAAAAETPTKQVPIGERKAAVRDATSAAELDAIEAAVNQEIEAGLRKNFPRSLQVMIDMRRDDFEERKTGKRPERKKKVEKAVEEAQAEAAAEEEATANLTDEERRVLDSIEAGLLTAGQIADDTGIKNDKVRKIARKLRDLGLIEIGRVSEKYGAANSYKRTTKEAPPAAEAPAEAQTEEKPIAEVIQFPPRPKRDRVAKPPKEKKEKAPPGPSQRKSKLTRAIETLQETLDEPWPGREEGQYSYLERTDDADKVDRAVEEIEHRWFITNGIADFIDTSFIEQVLNEMMDDAPSIEALVPDIVAALGNSADPTHQVRVFLNHEYPGAYTLKQARGASPTFEKGGSVSPTTRKGQQEAVKAGDQLRAPTESGASIGLTPQSGFRRFVEQGQTFEVEGIEEVKKTKTQEEMKEKATVKRVKPINLTAAEQERLDRINRARAMQSPITDELLAKIKAMDKYQLESAARAAQYGGLIGTVPNEYLARYTQEILNEADARGIDYSPKKTPEQLEKERVAEERKAKALADEADRLIEQAERQEKKQKKEEEEATEEELENLLEDMGAGFENILREAGLGEEVDMTLEGEEEAGEGGETPPEPTILKNIDEPMYAKSPVERALEEKARKLREKEQARKLEEFLEQMDQYKERYPKTPDELRGKEGDRVTDKMVRLLFKGWDVKQTASGWALTGPRGIRLDIVIREHVDMILMDMFQDPDKFTELMGKYGGNVKTLIQALRAGEERSLLGFYTQDRVTGVHMIALDSNHGTSETLFHEAFHFAFRNFLSDAEIATILKNYETEEHAAKAFGYKFFDTFNWAEEMSEGEVNSKVKDMGAVDAIFQKIKDIAGKIVRAMGIKPKSDGEAIAIMTADQIMDKISSAKIWKSSQMRAFIGNGTETLSEVQQLGFPRGKIERGPGFLNGLQVHPDHARLKAALDKYTWERIFKTGGRFTDGSGRTYYAVPVDDELRGIITDIRRKARLAQENTGKIDHDPQLLGTQEPNYMLFRSGNHQMHTEMLMLPNDNHGGIPTLTRFAATEDDVVRGWIEANADSLSHNDPTQETDIEIATRDVGEKVVAYATARISKLMKEAALAATNGDKAKAEELLRQLFGDDQIVLANRINSEINKGIVSNTEQLEKDMKEVQEAKDLSGLRDTPREEEAGNIAKPQGFKSLNESVSNTSALAQRRLRGLRKWASQNLTLFRGLPKELYVTILQRKRGAQSGRYFGVAARRELSRVVKTLKARHGEAKVNNALSMLLDGRMPMQQFRAIFALKNDDPVVSTLDHLQYMKAELQSRLANMPNIPEKMRQIILNNDYYQTRIYAIHVLGSGYVAKQDSYLRAVDAVADHYNDQLGKILTRATKVIGVKEPFDLPTYMESRTEDREKMLEGLPTSKASAIRNLAMALDPWMEAISSMELKEGNLVATINADSLATIAAQSVEGYLEAASGNLKRRPIGPIGGMPLSNLVERHLDQVFRDLYGEITDPAERYARTVEVQHDLVSAGMMFQKIFEEGEGKWWSRSRRGEFTQRLVGEGGRGASVIDHRRYGNMAGMFVTPETYDLLHGTGTFEKTLESYKLGRGFSKFQSVVRGTRLLWVKTVLRNAFTASTGFSLRSGDMLRIKEGWFKHYAEGWKIAAAAAAGTTEGNRKLAELVGKDIFDVSQDSMLAAIRANLESAAFKAGSKAGRSLNEAMKWYALIDLPAKYAGYMVSRNRGMSHEEAVSHVRNFYQYRDFVPEVVTKINRYPVGDYFGYTVDSTRIWVNTTKYAATSAAKGDVIPLIGYTLSATVPAFRYGTGGWLAALAPTYFMKAVQLATTGNLLAALGLSKDDDDDKVKIATGEEVAALRETLASYDRGMPLAVWYERGPDGKWGLRYNVMSNTGAFPIEDVVIGAIQTAASAPEGDKLRTFSNALVHNLGEAAPWHEGMAIDNLAQLAMGYDMSTGQKRPGLWDVWVSFRSTDSDIRPDAPKIIAERLEQFAGESFLPGQSYNAIRAAQELAQGREPRLGSYLKRKTKQDVQDVITRMVRKYRVDGDNQFNLLRQLVRPEMENLGISKSLAGSTARAGITYSEGKFNREILETERGRAAWRRSLKALEKDVEKFRIITRNNWTDDQIIDALTEFGTIRISEAEAVVKGTVDQMEAEAFKAGDDPYTTEPRPGRAQRGISFAKDYFRRNRGNLSYRELHAQMEAQGFIVGPYDKKFKDRMRRLRAEVVKED